MIRRFRTVILVVVAAAAVAGNAFGDTGCGTCEKSGKHHKAKESLTRELNLTADQEKLLEEQKASHREAMKALRDAVRQKKAALRDELAKPGTTKEQVAPIAAELKKLQSDMLDDRIEGIFAVKGILTPEQFSKLQAMKEKKMEAAKKKHGGKGER